MPPPLVSAMSCLLIVLLLLHETLAACTFTPSTTLVRPSNFWVNLTVLDAGGPASQFTIVFDSFYQFPPPTALAGGSSTPASCRLDASSIAFSSWNCSGSQVSFRIDTSPRTQYPAVLQLSTPLGGKCASTVSDKSTGTKPSSANSTVSGAVAPIPTDLASSQAASPSSSTPDLIDLGPFGQVSKLAIIVAASTLGVVALAVAGALWIRRQHKNSDRSERRPPGPGRDPEQPGDEPSRPATGRPSAVTSAPSLALSAVFPKIAATKSSASGKSRLLVNEPAVSSAGSSSSQGDDSSDSPLDLQDAPADVSRRPLSRSLVDPGPVPAVAVPKPAHSHKPGGAGSVRNASRAATGKSDQLDGTKLKRSGTQSSRTGPPRARSRSEHGDPPGHATDIQTRHVPLVDNGVPLQRSKSARSTRSARSKAESVFPDTESRCGSEWSHLPPIPQRTLLEQMAIDQQNRKRVLVDPRTIIKSGSSEHSHQTSSSAQRLRSTTAGPPGYPPSEMSFSRTQHLPLGGPHQSGVYPYGQGVPAGHRYPLQTSAMIQTAPNSGGMGIGDYAVFPHTMPIPTSMLPPVLVPVPAPASIYGPPRPRGAYLGSQSSAASCDDDVPLILSQRRR